MYDLKKSIKNIIEYNYSPLQCINELNIVNIGYGIDDNYARCAGTSITSFCLNNPERNFIFHILVLDLSNINKKKYNLLAKQYSTKIIIYEMDISYLESLNLPTGAMWSLPMYFRFILPIILSGQDKLVYIDSDIICINNATDLFNINPNKNIIAAVAEPKNKELTKRCDRLN